MPSAYDSADFDALLDEAVAEADWAGFEARRAEAATRGRLRGIGLANKIRAYALQERGLDTVEANTELGFPADMRDYGTAVQILRVLGIGRLRLLSNNPRKRAALERYGIAVAERRTLRIGPNPHNATYLETKRLKLGHDLTAGFKVVSEQ